MSSNKSVTIGKPPRICRLAVGDAFNKLTTREKLYAHHMSRAAWHGTRIILEQVSPESPPIFDFILELYRACDGDWAKLATQAGVSMTDMDHFLEYAAAFLGNIGNYYGHGDQKFVPNVTKEFLERVSVSEVALGLYGQFAEAILALYPSGLGFPSKVAQSAYYPGDPQISREEIAAVSKVMEDHSIHPENTRIRKSISDNKPTYDILQASIESGPQPLPLQTLNSSQTRLIRGDHSRALTSITSSLSLALAHTSSPTQKSFITSYLESFLTGSIEAYKTSQRTWIKDLQPPVETVLGFVEPYRDPFGIRAEFEGVVGVVDREETRMLRRLVESEGRFVRRLPWAEGAVENEGKGPFEKDLFEEPDFTSLHTLAYCSSIIFPGINLPNYNDIRQTLGSKNVLITNSMTTTPPKEDATHVPPSETPQYLSHKQHTFHLWVIFHELLGHGTGKLLSEENPGVFNFDINNPPLNPLTGKPIDTWYRPGQTWTGVFGDIATSVDECRAECVGAYLMSDMELLGMFGYTEETAITGRDLEYNMYMQLGVAGLRALENYMVEDRKWGQAHSRAHFAIFKTLLSTPNDFLTITHLPASPSQKLTISINRAKIPTHGRPALSALLLKLHIYRCTADVANCRKFYEELTEVEGVFLEWREVVVGEGKARVVWVQGNSFLEGGEVVLREYEETAEGVVRSWAERGV